MLQIVLAVFVGIVIGAIVSLVIVGRKVIQTIERTARNR